MNRIETLFPLQAVRPYEDPYGRLVESSVQKKPILVVNNNPQARSTRTLTLRERYCRKEEARGRVDISEITGRQNIGTRGSRKK